MKKLFTVLFIIIAVGSGFFGRLLMRSLADENKQGEPSRYYKSISIERGDSLWSIAQRYHVEGFTTTEEYVQELRTMNRLKEDTIHAGQYLTIVYFTEEEVNSDLE